MRHCLIIAYIFFSCFMHAAMIDVARHEPDLQKSYHFALQNDPGQAGLKEFHKQLLDPLPRSLKSELSLDFINQETSIDGKSIIRSTPIINNIIVEGADGIYSTDVNNARFSYSHFSMPKAQFILSPALALSYAIAVQPASTIKNPFVERTDALFEPLWLMHFGKLRPAFKTRLPTLSIYDLKDIYVDAENGEILKIEDAAWFAQAPTNLFIYSPPNNSLDPKNLKQVNLENLTNLKENGFLEGEYIEVKTCCKYFSCPDGNHCDNAEKRCALKSHDGAQQSREVIELPTESLGLDPLLTLPSTVTVDTVRCTYLPFARASLNASKKLGFFEEPIDDDSPEAEMDRFSEIQAYYSVSSFFNFIRGLMNNSSWCLRETAMSCNTDGSPKLDSNKKPVNPYRVFVNQMIPDLKIDAAHQSDPENFIAQILAGRGIKSNPISLNNFSRFSNAAFIPALSQLKANTPRADEILSDLIKPFDHNVFFQGERDFAYDGDVVFHEFMHAITASLVNKINTLGLNDWGIHAEPGSLNEAWSDYFAAAFTEDPAIGEYAAVSGAYGEIALRTIDNKKSCPEDMIGEIHNDGQVWSGALWELRDHFAKTGGTSLATEFDRAVLAALAQASKTEDYKSQSASLISAVLARESLGENAAAYVESVLKKRGLKDCFRAFTLSLVDKHNIVTYNTKDMLFVASKNQIGLKNYAPSSSQLEIGIPAGATSLTLSWQQFLGGTGALLGSESTPDATNLAPLGVLSSLDVPITWNFQDANAKAYRDGVAIQSNVSLAHYDNGKWQYSMKLNFDRCEQRTIYFSLLSSDLKYVLKNINVSFDIDTNTKRSDCNFTGSLRGYPTTKEAAHGCTSNSPPLELALCLALLMFFRKRRA
jgi:hypothetical protein